MADQTAQTNFDGMLGFINDAIKDGYSPGDRDFYKRAKLPESSYLSRFARAYGTGDPRSEQEQMADKIGMFFLEQKLKGYAGQEETNRLVPQQTLGELREAVGPETFAAAGGRIPMTAPTPSLTGGGITPPERPLPTKGPMIAPIPPMGASSFAPRFDVEGGTSPPTPAFQTPSTIQPPPQLTGSLQPTILPPREMLEAPIPPLVRRGIIDATEARSKALPVKPTYQEQTGQDLRKYYLTTGDLKGLERLGGTREKAKEDRDEAEKLGDILTAAGVEKDSPQWKKAFGAMAEKLVTHQPSTQINIDTQKKASEQAQEEQMKSTRVTFDQLKHAPVLLENIEKAKALIPKAKGFMGTGGETLLEVTKFLNNRIGTNINPSGVKTAEELRSRIFFNIMDNLKKMDAQPSQLQQQIMAESLGKLGTDPNALADVLDAYGDAIRGKVELHNTEVKGAVERNVKFPYDPTIKLKPKVSPFVEFRVDKQGRKLGKRADGTVEVIK